MRRSLVLDVTAPLVADSALVLAVYLLAAGHNQPGGGFIGGLVAGAAVGLHYVVGGLDRVRAVARVRPWTVLSAGLGLAAAGALAPMLAGGAALEQGYVSLHPPLLGDVKLTSALVFDTGVFGVVVGTVLMAFEGLGEEQPPAEAQAAPGGDR